MLSSWKTSFKKILAAFLFFFATTLAVGSENKSTENPPLLQPDSSIPYPDGAIYLKRAIYASLSGGQYRNLGDPRSLYQWQGEIGYFYTPWFSGGVAFKMIAGQPSDSNQTVKNRFFILGRFHKSWSQVAAFVGIEGGVDDLNISLTPLDTGDYRQPLANLNAGMGLEFGLGWKFCRYAGLTFGQHFEASFVGQDTAHASGSLNFRTQPGIAVDILALAPSMRKKVKALNFFVESQFGKLVLENESKSNDFAWISGFTMAF